MKSIEFENYCWYRLNWCLSADHLHHQWPAAAVIHWNFLLASTAAALWCNKMQTYLALNQCYKVLPCDTISHLPCDMIWHFVTFLETWYDTLWHPFAFIAKFSLQLVMQKATPVHSFAAMHKGSVQLRDRWCNTRVKDPKEKATQTNTIECNPVTF